MNLVINSTTPYTSGRPANLLNTAAGNVLSVALMSGSAVDLHFTFFNRGDNGRVPVSVKSFFFSILDMDVGGQPLDSVGLTGFHSVTVTQHTLLTETKKAQWVHFKSVSDGSDFHDVLNPMDLTESQQSIPCPSCTKTHQTSL